MTSPDCAGRRWTLTGTVYAQRNRCDGPDIPPRQSIVVMPVVEHEVVLAAARQVDRERMIDAAQDVLASVDFALHDHDRGQAGMLADALLAALNVPSEVGKSADVPSESASDLERARLGADLAALREAAQAVAEAVPLPGGSLAGLFTAVGRLRAALASADSEADR